MIEEVLVPSCRQGAAARELCRLGHISNCFLTVAVHTHLGPSYEDSTAGPIRSVRHFDGGYSLEGDGPRPPEVSRRE